MNLRSSVASYSLTSQQKKFLELIVKVPVDPDSKMSVSQSI